MNENYDYKESLNNIKANLFDIYEDQERIVGLISNNQKRNRQVEDFIKVKDLALKLVNDISDLYEKKNIVRDNNISKKRDNNVSLVETDTDKLLEQVNNDSVDIDKDDSSKEIVEENVENDLNSEDDSSNLEDEPLIKMKEFDNTNIDEEKDIEKYYLDCDEKKLNFAYVPEELFEIIKNHKDIEDTEDKVDTVSDSDTEQVDVVESNENTDTESDDDFNEEIEFSNEEDETDNSEGNENDDSIDIEESEEEEIDKSKFYKKDDDNVRGIIVRGDQFMKLALSKHRQEGVLEEAKNYRIETVKRQRKEKQKAELEKAKVHIDI